jgi:hypothetical protein
MNEFPSYLHVSNKDKFNELFFDECVSIFRKTVVNHLLTQKENDFIDLDTFNRTHVRDMKLTQKIVSIIQTELTSLGWYTHLGFGDTGLYIYSTAEKPSGVY